MKRALSKHVALITLVGLLIVPSLASAATTSVSQVMSGGSLSVSSDASASFTARTISSSEQSGTASVGLSISDTRGSGAGWTVTMTATPLTTTRIFADSANTGDMIMTQGTGKYTGAHGQIDHEAPCMLTYIVVTGGSAGTATFTVADNTVQNSSCTYDGSSTPTSQGDEFTVHRGITADISGSGTTGDKFYVLMDMYPGSDLSAVCNAAVATSGTTDQVSAGSCGAFSGSNVLSDSLTVLTAPAGYGLGTYTQQIDYTLTMHQNAIAGTYLGSLTFTIA